MSSFKDITEPTKLLDRDEVLSRPSPVPALPGVYGWYFKEIPPGVPVDGCIKHDGLTLLYVGISPRRPSADGKSGQNLRKRIRAHYAGNASGSTLRLTLGILLEERLGLQLRRTGSSNRLTFGAGEMVLSEWMAANAFVCWSENDQPRDVEEQLISSLSLPLNLEGNRSRSFFEELQGLRSEARQRALERRPVSS